MTSSPRRLGRIFGPDRRTVIIALDHGLIDGPCPGFEQPAETIAAVVAGGPDAVLTSRGIAESFAAELSPVGLILRSDGSTTGLGPGGPGPAGSFFGPEDALRLGADAVAVTAMPGSDSEADTLRTLARTVSEAGRWGLPVMAEMVPGGFGAGPEQRGAEAVALAARLGAELGADLIKAPYCPDYARVTVSTFAPVVILGGSKGSEADTLAVVRAALDAGAAGVAMGRNVFQSPDPAAMTRALATMVHGDAGLTDALAVLRG